MSTDVNGVYRTTLTVRGPTGDPQTPSIILLTVTAPDQTISTPEIQVLSAGVFYVDVILDQEGLWKFEWVTTGPNTSKVDYENAVRYRSVLGLDEAREYLGLHDSSRDELLRMLLMTATEMAEGIAGTCVSKQVTNERIPGYNRQAISLPSGPVIPDTDITISSIWQGGPVWQTEDLIVSYASAVVDTANMQGFWYGPWKASYVAGRVVIPQKIVQAVREIVFDLWGPVRAAMGDMQEPGLIETAQYELAIPANYVMPHNARALLLREALPGFA